MEITLIVLLTRNTSPRLDLRFTILCTNFDTLIEVSYVSSRLKHTPPPTDYKTH